MRPPGFLSLHEWIVSSNPSLRTNFAHYSVTWKKSTESLTILNNTHNLLWSHICCEHQWRISFLDYWDVAVVENERDGVYEKSISLTKCLCKDHLNFRHVSELFRTPKSDAEEVDDLSVHEDPMSGAIVPSTLYNSMHLSWFSLRNIMTWDSLVSSREAVARATRASWICESMSLLKMGTSLNCVWAIPNRLYQNQKCGLDKPKHRNSRYRILQERRTNALTLYRYQLKPH